MNWFMYIGGGILWCFLWLAIINTLSNGMKDNDEKVIFRGVIYLGSIFVWVWVCWKFI